MKADIITGQFVRIAQTPATVADRILGRVVDDLLLAVYLTAMTVLLTWIDGKTGFTDSSYGGFFLIAIFVVLYLPALLYTFLCEAFFNGQTIGKRVMKTRVVNADGSQPGIGQLFLRWLLLLVDEGVGLVGIVVIMLNRNGQRLGDMAAGTFVIRLQGYRQLKVTLDDFQYATSGYSPVYPQAAALSLGQAEVVRKTLQAGGEPGQEQMHRLAAKVEKALGIQRREPSAEAFLLTVLHDYQYYALELV